MINKAVAFHPPIILVVQEFEAAAAKHTGRALEGAGGALHAVAFQALTREYLDALNPGIVLCSLFSARFDCMDVAGVLAEAEYSGRLQILSIPLPRPHLVLLELKQSFPTLDIEFVALPERPAQAIRKPRTGHA